MLAAVMLTGCTEASDASYQIAREADGFKVTRKVTVINTRTDDVIYEEQGLISVEISNGNAESKTANTRLDILIKDGDRYKKQIVGLNQDTMFIVEDLEGVSLKKETEE